MMSEIKISATEHLAHPFRVHSLLSDFELEDVWRVPVQLTTAQSLQLFMETFTKSNANTVKGGVTGLLFKIRLTVGKWFKWDEAHIQDKLIPGTIRFRYAEQERLTYSDLPNPGTESFIPVYKLENEFLAEIENSTVQAALHLSRVPIDEDQFAIQMAVYVKPKGWLGRLYMVLIKPFRLWIVYPALMSAAKQNWERSLSGREK